MLDKKSGIISGMGVGMEIIQQFVRKAHKAGCSDEDIHWLVTPDGQEILEKFAIILAKKRGRSPFRVKVGGTKLGTSELIKASGYSFIWEAILDSGAWQEGRPCQIGGEPESEVDFSIFEREASASSQAVIDKAEEQELRRPTTEEALWFGRKLVKLHSRGEVPEQWQGRPVVLLLDVPWLHRAGDRFVLDFWVRPGGVELDGNWFDGRWDAHDCFAFPRRRLS